MNNLFKSKKNIFIIIAIFIIILLSVQFLFAGNKTEKESTDKEITQEEVIPTVDNSVQVNLTKEQNASEVVLSIKDFPPQTEKIEYELSYQTEAQGLQGVVGSIDYTAVEKNEYEKKITLGTCSSGKCVYHKVVGNIKLLLRFNGKYGMRIFEKEYEL